MGKGLGEALAHDFEDLLDLERLAIIFVRLLFAALLGGLLGYQRERAGKAAGMRTHMLVAVGAAFFMLVPQLEGMQISDLSRVLQGITAGIGFLGAGAILKLTDERKIRGLTTAAGIWMTAAVGVAAGVGRLGSAILAALLAFVVMDFLYRLDRAISDEPPENA
ncbi:MAG: MgtC/SapB family protein [Gemmataceae bacterium]|nr:MgtC/SapB family protein [Gemmataceae bacterium]